MLRLENIFESLFGKIVFLLLADRVPGNATIRPINYAGKAFFSQMPWTAPTDIVTRGRTSAAKPQLPMR